MRKILSASGTVLAVLIPVIFLLYFFGENLVTEPPKPCGCLDPSRYGPFV